MRRRCLSTVALLLVLACSAAAQRDRVQLPPAQAAASTKRGLQPLDNGPGGGLLYVPKVYRPDHSFPALILLHASGGDPADWFPAYGRRADAGSFIVIAPRCLHRTWGAGTRDLGNDVAVINRALFVAASRCAIDRTHLAIAGFSDGASYALSLAIANGDLLKSVIAFSPGYFIGTVRRGNPAIFIAHGVNDEILPLDNSSRRFVAVLRKAGYAVEYREFYGGHEMSPRVTDEASSWLRARFAH